jgi:hypothetical protein
MVGIVTDKFHLLAKIRSVVLLLTHRQCENLVHEISRTFYRCAFVSFFFHYDTNKTKCAIPVFEGLLPKKHDRIVSKLLFELCTWHGLAKLRLHTETTVNDLEHSTTRLGKLLREFREEVCSCYATKELPSEEAARIRCKAAAAKKQGQSAAPPLPDAPKSRQERTFNLSTYKLHSLGHYARAIRLFGSTDNFNSQTVTINLFHLK